MLLINVNRRRAKIVIDQHFTLLEALHSHLRLSFFLSVNFIRILQHQNIFPANFSRRNPDFMTRTFQLHATLLKMDRKRKYLYNKCICIMGRFIVVRVLDAPSDSLLAEGIIHQLRLDLCQPRKGVI